MGTAGDPEKNAEVHLFFEESAVAPAPSESICPSSLRILLVDDDELIRSSVGPMLEILGHQVQVAESGQAALDRFEAGLEVEVVILDMNMPGLNGAETLSRLRQLRPQQVVLMASGYNDRDVQDLLAGHPGVASIQKPFSLQDIQQKLGALKLPPGRP